ncbi:MAG: lactate utilization protein [Erysipelotrichales bacterium]|nr:lactate utilization protein [Erysipelotrichales bacterium]
MEENLNELMKIKENELIKAFEKHNMTMLVVKDREELETYLKNVFVNGKKVAVGGSVTLNQLGVIDMLRSSDVDFIDRYEEGLTREEVEQRFREAFFADLFITSTNALTMDGCLYNVDGTGNRVAAMIYGPKEVIVIAGLNKICLNEQEAIDHIKNCSAPANAMRLNKKTPCTKMGKCIECHSPDRICSSYVKLGYQGKVNRIKVILVEDYLGY